LTVSGANGSTDLTTQLHALRGQLSRREFAAAHAAARALAAQYPGNRDVLYGLAVTLRCLDRITEALETLQELEQHHPRFGRLFEERGYCHLAREAMDPAIQAFAKAVTLNPSLPASLKILQDLYRRRGHLKEAEATGQLRANLESLPREIAMAHGMFADGEIEAAEQLVRRYLLTHGDHVDGMYLLARMALTHDVSDDPANQEAEVLLEKVLRIAPDHHPARYAYAEVLFRRLKHFRAREELEKLLAIAPGDRAYLMAHAHTCAGLGDYEQALSTYQKLLSEAPEVAQLHLAAGFALKTLGRTAEAVQSYRAAAALRPAHGSAYWNLANLKTYRFEDAELEQMTRYEADARTTAVDRYHLAFALGKAFEDRGEYERSFRYYERGNELRKRESRYQPEVFENHAREEVATCTREFFAARQGWGYPDAAPIFIVGLPRAGSTLIEQILASHSQVEGTLELPNILHLIRELCYSNLPAGSSNYPGVLARLGREDCARLGEQYIRDTRAYRHGKAFFIDKWPSNFRDLGLIHLILPNSRVIDARREAMACCFSNFKHLFSADDGPRFVYSFEDLARYYHMYVGLMSHWDAVLPGKILRVQHEELVTEFPANLQRIMEFCGLEAEPACYEFYKSDRAVVSSSSEQVRQPLNRAGIDHWRHFERWLGPLKEELRIAEGARLAPSAAYRSH
jgi:tetratricopeptide (TPR) repeat protein